jgi:hypothetical protein
VKVFAMVVFIPAWVFGQAPLPVRGPRLAPPVQVRIRATQPLPWWNSAERERVRALGAPYFFEARTFPGRPDLGNPQTPQFPKPLW